MQGPRKRNKLPVWDGASMSAAWQGEYNKMHRDVSPSLTFRGLPTLQDHLMTHLFPEHHSEPGTGPGREARGRTRERTSGTNFRGSGVAYSWGDLGGLQGGNI